MKEVPTLLTGRALKVPCKLLLEYLPYMCSIVHVVLVDMVSMKPVVCVYHCINVVSMRGNNGLLYKLIHKFDLGQ